MLFVRPNATDMVFRTWEILAAIHCYSVNKRRMHQLKPNTPKRGISHDKSLKGWHAVLFKMWGHLNTLWLSLSTLPKLASRAVATAEETLVVSSILIL